MLKIRYAFYKDKKMKFAALSSIARIAALTALVASSAAYAGGNESFDLTFSGTLVDGDFVSGNVDITGTAVGNGEFAATSASGTINGQAATLLGTSGFATCTTATCGAGLDSMNGNTDYFEGTFLFNNVIYTGNSTALTGGFGLDEAGLGFVTAAGNVNLYSLNGSYGYTADLNGSNNPINATLVAAVPEPSSYLMMLVGLIGIGYAAARNTRRSSNTAQPALA